MSFLDHLTEASNSMPHDDEIRIAMKRKQEVYELYHTECRNGGVESASLYYFIPVWDASRNNLKCSRYHRFIKCDTYEDLDGELQIIPLRDKEMRWSVTARERALINIILFFGRNNDRNVQRFVNGRFGDRIWTYLCIKINVYNHIRYFVGPNDSHVRSKSRPKIVILHLQSLYKVPKKFFYGVFGPNKLLVINEYVHNRSLKRPLTNRCTFRSLLRPKTRIMFARGDHWKFVAEERSV